MDKKVVFAVIVSALGYFVDVYDLILFSVVRVASLKDLGLEGDALTDTGVFLLNMQLAGMLIGGVMWGVWGDKKGRLSILFGSILLYSLANLANAYVTSVEQYAICRFLAGLGLAGEIGAGITLVAELMPKDKRGIGTMIVATCGVMGGLAAATIGDVFHWKTAYIVGGSMGLALFVLRVAVSESGLFEKLEGQKHVRRGDLKMLLTRPDLFKRYILCILVGMPIWYLVGLIITFAPEIGRTLAIAEPLTTAKAILYFYGGIVLGDFASGTISQLVKSRKKVLWGFVAGALVFTLLALNLPDMQATTFYALAGVLGFFAGYWAVFLTTTAENFGTNLRATVTTSVPNMVRGGAILLSSAFGMMKGHVGVIPSLEIIGLATFGAAFYAIYRLRETFSLDLEYVEDGK